MLSSDPKLLDSGSAVSHRMSEYGSYMELTVILAGRGVPGEVKRGGYRLIFPGGASRLTNFFRTLYAIRVLDADVVSAQDPFYLGLIGVLSGVRPLQIQLHTDNFGLVGAVLSRITLSRASCVRAVSAHIERKIRALTQAPISVLPIFVDPEPLLRSYNAPQEFASRPAILTVSRLAPEKRVDRIIRALAHIPDAHLYIVGDGLLRKSLQLVADRSQLGERVHFLGWKNDVAQYYQHADCYVQASAFEGYGMSLMEAVLAGCPAVSSSVGIAPELSSKLVTISEPSEYALAGAIHTSLSQGRDASRREAHEALLRSLPTKEMYLMRYSELLASCHHTTS